MYHGGARAVALRSALPQHRERDAADDGATAQQQPRRHRLVQEGDGGGCGQRRSDDLHHRGLRSDRRAPFRLTLRVRGRALLRARVALGVDRLVSVDRTVRGC